MYTWCMHACLHVYAYVYVYVYVWMYMHRCIRTYRQTYRQTDIHTCIPAYLHAYMHTYSHDVLLQGTTTTGGRWRLIGATTRKWQSRRSMAPAPHLFREEVCALCVRLFVLIFARSFLGTLDLFFRSLVFLCVRSFASSLLYWLVRSLRRPFCVRFFHPSFGLFRSFVC